MGLFGGKILDEIQMQDILAEMGILLRKLINEIEIQMAETSETVEKRDKDLEKLCAKFDEYKEKAKDRDE